MTLKPFCSCSLRQFGVTAPFLQQNVHGYECIGRRKMTLDLHRQASAKRVDISKPASIPAQLIAYSAASMRLGLRRYIL